MSFQMQILDCDYVLVNNKPVVRMFGKTMDGKTICAFYDKFLPYFYLVADEKKFAEIIIDLEGKFDVMVEIVTKLLPFGFQSPINVLKITGKEPNKVPEIREYARRYGTPYEADILFNYRFMIDNKLKGMCWFDVKGEGVSTKTISCKAVRADSFKQLDILENAPLKYMAFDIECISDEDRIPDPKKDPIVMISFYFYPDYNEKKSVVLISKFATGIGKDVICCENEEEMLKKFIDIINGYDPDIIVGYNINNFDMPYIVSRMEELNIPRVFGRGNKYVTCRKMQFGYSISILGRIVADPYQILKNDQWISFRRYDLGTVAKEMLGIEKLDVHGMKEMRSLWNGDNMGLKKFIDYCRRDSELALKLVIKKGLLDKFFELAKVSGILLQDAFGGQSQRLDCKLLHEFRDRNLILPCKPTPEEIRKRKNEREEAGLKGAIVLEPEIGMHAKGCILVLDFKSLYPSIIRTFNICPTTLLKNRDVDCIISPIGTKFVKKEIRKGVLPKIVDELIETRHYVKKKMKSETDIEIIKILDAKQLALKTLANSLYGYTGFIMSRLYILDIANSITSIGRDNIIKTRGMIENKFGYKVLYGDTDSIFVSTDILDLDKAHKVGNEISKYATENLSGLELEFEKIFKSFLILAKKRYAGWSFEPGKDGWKSKIVMKGIETVRRDWCELVSDTMKEVLGIVLKEHDIQKASKYVRDIIKKLEEREIDLEKLTVIKGITKSVDSYGGINIAGGRVSPPAHAELAKKIIERDKSRGSLVGSRIGYVIIKGNQMLSKRAEEPEYVKEHGIEIDAQYYIENQLLPPIERIFDACGIKKDELIEGRRQKSLFDVLQNGIKSPEMTVLKNWDDIVCSKCDWSFRRPPLKGICPACGSGLYFRYNGSVGKFVEFK